jgi:hypothetical protein
LSADHLRLKPSLMRFGVVGAIVVLVGAYVAAVALYASSGMSDRHEAGISTASDVTAVTLYVEDVQSNYSELLANLVFSAGPDVLDRQTQRLKEDLSLRVRSAARPTQRTYTKGMLPGMFPVPLTLAGEINDWPFDRYRTGPIEVELVHGGAETAARENTIGFYPQRVPVTFVDHLSGWQINTTSDANGVGPYQVSLRRSLSASAFGVVILGVFIAIAGLSLFVAVQTVRNRRLFQPPMTTWYAAMLFAVVPLRSALPGSPPFGAWIDVTIVLWVLVVLVISMLLYITCWWRHLRPDAEKPTTPAASPAPSVAGLQILEGLPDVADAADKPVEVDAGAVNGVADNSSRLTGRVWSQPLRRRL